MFKVAQANDLEIHPDALRQIRQDLKRIDGRVRENREANAIFLDILTAREGAERTLRMMNEAGVFGRFVPDFGRVNAQSTNTSVQLGEHLFLKCYRRVRPGMHSKGGRPSSPPA